MARLDVKLDPKLCKHINTYFRGASIMFPVILCIIGLLAAVGGVATNGGAAPIAIGAVLLIVGIVWICILKSLSGKRGEAEVDQAVALIKNQVISTGCDVLNIAPEEVDFAEPLLLCGPASEPTPDIDMRNPVAVMRSRRGGLLKSLFNKMKKKDFEPELIRKFGSDYKFRFSLVEVTCFFYGEKQLYATSVKVDLTTGYTYANGSYEMFYEDINGLELDGEKRNIKVTTGCKNQTKLVPFFKAWFCLYASGCSIKKAMIDYGDDYEFDNALKAMRSLIRERKNNR